MAPRRIDPRAIKLSRTYDVGELAALLRVHKNTVRHWQGDGLKPLDTVRPILFHGSTVRDYLGKRRASRRTPCPPDLAFDGFAGATQSGISYAEGRGISG